MSVPVYFTHTRFECNKFIIHTGIDVSVPFVLLSHIHLVIPLASVPDYAARTLHIHLVIALASVPDYACRTLHIL